MSKNWRIKMIFVVSFIISLVQMSWYESGSPDSLKFSRWMTVHPLVGEIYAMIMVAIFAMAAISWLVLMFDAKIEGESW